MIHRYKHAIFLISKIYPNGKTKTGTWSLHLDWIETDRALYESRARVCFVWFVVSPPAIIIIIIMIITIFIMVWPVAAWFGPASPLCQNTHIAIEAKLCAKMEQHNKQNWDNQKAEITKSSLFLLESLHYKISVLPILSPKYHLFNRFRNIFSDMCHKLKLPISGFG